LKKTITAITTAGLVLIMCNSVTITRNPIQKSSSNFRVKDNAVVITTDTIDVVKNIVPMADTGIKYDISSYYHKQMDSYEYRYGFLYSVRDYFDGEDVRYNFCGVMTLLNTMDIIQGYNSVSATEIVNTYFVDDNGNIVSTYEGRGSAFRDSNGSISPTSLYWMADKIGADTELWYMTVVYGAVDFTLLEPVRKSDVEQIVEKAKTEVFDNNGAVIAHVGIASAGQFSYWHFIVIEDMKINTSGDLELLIVDSMGYYGWVNANEYLISAEPYNSDIFTGIVNLYGVIPNR